MPITQLKSKSEISKIIDQRVDKLELSLVAMLIGLGKICIDDMEKNRGYKNVSNNLSDSRGFVVVKNKSIIYSSLFKNTVGGQTGRSLTIERASQSNGIMLIVVAGMKYAELLEAVGKNVITSSELMAESLVPTLLNQLQ